MKWIKMVEKMLIFQLAQLFESWKEKSSESSAKRTKLFTIMAVYFYEKRAKMVLNCLFSSLFNDLNLEKRDQMSLTLNCTNMFTITAAFQ